MHLHFPDAGSLKGKRSELQSIKAVLQGRLNAAVSEVDHQDVWQRSTLAVALTAGSEHGAIERADAMQRMLEERLPQGVRVERMIASWSDLESIG